MAGTPNSIITPQTPFSIHANLSGVTAITSRAPITSATGLTQIGTNTANVSGRQINSIIVRGSGNTQVAATVPMIITIWQYDGSTAWPVEDITVTAVTPATVTAPFYTKVNYTNWIIPSTHSLYACQSITTTTTTAVIVQVLGGDL